MTTWLLVVALTTTPPLMAPGPPPPMPGPAVGPQLQRSPGARLLPPPQPLAPAPRSEPASLRPQEPARVGVTFTPLSVFAAALFAEVDVALYGGLDVFATIGGGFFGQFGFEGGLRFYAEGRPMEGFFVEGRACGFMLPDTGLFLMAPGMQLGHAWRVGAFAISIGLGFNTWYTLSAGTGQGVAIFGPPTPTDVIVFPGLQVPVGQGPAVQPTARISIGFTL